jgi:hypothetical protein
LYIHDQLWDMGHKIAMELPIMNRFVWKSNQSNFFYKRIRLSFYYFNPIILFQFFMIFFNVQNQMY